MSDSKWQYFSDHELQCHGTNCCGGQSSMDHDFMVKVVAMRRTLGFPFNVTSGYRCPLHNSRISSTGETGPHTTGHALDIMIEGENAFRLLRMALDFGMTGIGVSQKGQHRFIHIDDLKGDKRPRVWSY